MDEEPNIWACINRMFELNSKDECKTWDIKIRKRYINLGTGYSSTDDKEIAVFKNVDINDVSDTCDDQTRYQYANQTKAGPDNKSMVS